MLHVHACLTIQVQSNKLVTCTTITHEINILTADTEAKCPRSENKKRGEKRRIGPKSTSTTHRLKHQIPLALTSIPKASDLREMLPSAVLLAYLSCTNNGCITSQSPPLQFSSYYMFFIHSNDKRKRQEK